ncbi:Developmentally-regulated GTP-binding protein 1 [Geodia barretti]|uniref:Developmentally-regulated GTP-binding protein 1 n=1 Tax=Geodia barretti TaxID=519541 RepID=A0AA35SJ17_GEOBA|nr:Developmentally-regulated GTP-binding protein 1 [Geodia barretti]
MPTILEQIADIEAEMARTQRNKATERHFGVLKAKLAKLRRELITPKGGSSGPGEGFDVAKTGDARIGFVENCSWERRGVFIRDVPLFQRSTTVLSSAPSSLHLSQDSHQWVSRLC